MAAIIKLQYWKPVVWTIGALVVIAAAMYGVVLVNRHQFEATYRPRLQEKFGSEENVKFLSSVTAIEAWRIGELSDEEMAAGDSGYLVPPEKYPIISGAIELRPEEMSGFLEIFQTASSYEWDPVRAKACIFRPGVRLHLYGPEDQLDVLLCFGCSDMAVFRKGERVGFADFSPARAALAALVKRTFPTDTALQ